MDFRNCYAPPSKDSIPVGKGTAEVARFPGGLNDCYSGLEWVHGHAKELNVDSSKILLAGISGGCRKKY